MLDIMFDMPSRKDITHYVITPEVVRGEASVFPAQEPAKQRKQKRA